MANKVIRQKKKTMETANPVRNFTLPRSITIENVQAVLVEIKEHNIADGTRFIIDASDADIITSPALQMLASLDLTVEGKGGRLEISSRSDAFASACATLGMTAQLYKWENTNV